MLDNDLCVEYELDACLIATASCDLPVCSDEHLESAWLWLADVHDLLAGIRRLPPQHSPSVSPWLIAAHDVPDLLLMRHRPGLALSLLRKAWKQAPADIEASPELLAVVVGLLEPFAPVLGWSLRQHFGTPLRTLEETRQFLARTVPNLRLIRLQIDRGARHTVVVHTQQWQQNPLQALAQQEAWAARLIA
ncbi:MAG TPA: hypothetical protein PKO06_16740, partial [Candidatus Ozemobacteraceae bacterium]|nr:hypothetical protein [Candidatus Ozemobacteraceae bacterium]